MKSIVIFLFIQLCFASTTDTLIRVVPLPTRANLDHAAWENNPAHKIQWQPEQKVEPFSWSDVSFADAIVAYSHQIPNELKSQPLSWKPLANFLLKQKSSLELNKIIQPILRENLGLKSLLVRPFSVPTIYVSPQDLWLEIQSESWANPQDCEDLDTDGFCEIFAVIKLTDKEKTALQKAIPLIEKSYQNPVLNVAEIKNWANVLSSYWYPSYNTDLTPNPKAEWVFRGDTLKNIAAVFRSNPEGKELYTILQVPGTDFAEKDTSTQVSITHKQMDQKSVLGQLDLLKQHYQDILTQVETGLSDSAKMVINQKLSSIPERQMTLPGDSSWLFFRKSIDYHLSQNIVRQDRKYNPLPHLIELKDFLNGQNINFLVVPIPPKTAVYPEYWISANEENLNYKLMQSHYRLMEKLTESGIETIDFLPDLLKDKNYDANYPEPLYQKRDTHWSWRGIVTLARLLVPRILKYGWVKNWKPQREGFTMEQTTFSRLGDLVERLPSEQQGQYPPDSLMANVMKKNGQMWKPKKGAPIMLIGDSFTGVYELTDAKSSGIASHIAFGTGLDVDLVTSWGGGPNVRRRMMRARKKHLANTQLVIYLMAARDFWNYSQTWKDQKY